jgi:hypothetical protein
MVSIYQTYQNIQLHFPEDGTLQSGKLYILMWYEGHLHKMAISILLPFPHSFQLGTFLEVSPGNFHMHTSSTCPAHCFTSLHVQCPTNLDSYPSPCPYRTINSFCTIYPSPNFMMDPNLFVTLVNKHSVIIYSYVMAVRGLVLHFFNHYLFLSSLQNDCGYILSD